MNKETAIEIASKYANDIWLFGGVDKECVSKVCKTLLDELDITNNKLQEVKEEIEESLNYYLKENGILEIKYVKERYLKPLLSIIGGE